MKIVVLDGYTLNPGDNPWTEVETLGELTVYDRTPSDEIVQRAQDAEILLTNKTPLTDKTIASLPKLRFIGVTATGYNVVDTTAARAQGIPVANVPIYGTDTVAEYVIALIQNHYRQAAFHADLVKKGEWESSIEFSFWRTPLAELAGKTIGIVGFGRIGRRVGELASAFKMKVLAYDTHRNQRSDFDFSWTELDELFAQSDIVTLHCPQTAENTGMVNAALLAKMKPTAMLVNTARGGLVNEDDLAAALNGNTIAAAACDVVSSEPIKSDNPLLKAKNIYLTPHIAWAAIEARKRLMETTAENVAAFIAGAPIHVVN